MTTPIDVDGRPRILIVEDQPDVQILLTKILIQAGYEITSTSDGERALRLLAELEFDLVVLDVMMPKLDGYAVLRSMRHLGRFSSTAVVMLTALGSDRDWLKALHLGAHDYLPKPFDPDELLRLVESLLAMGPTARSHHRETCLDRSRLLAQLEVVVERGLWRTSAA